MESDSNFLKRNGDVRNLKAYKVSVIISFITDFFVKKYINSRSRTVDQMQQAARSCKQNIVEGHDSGLTSKETEIKLTNVARASLSELEEDFIDYLKFNNLELWQKDNSRLIKLREYVRTPDFEQNYPILITKLNAEEICNLSITLIKQTQFLLDRIIEKLKDRFLREGGIREQMTRARIMHRNGYTNPPRQNPPSSNPQ